MYAFKSTCGNIYMVWDEDRRGIVCGADGQPMQFNSEVEANQWIGKA